MALKLDEPVQFTISHRGTPHHLSLLPETTLSVLQLRLEELTSVPVSNQKLLFKGKKANANDDDTIVQAGFKSGVKVQMLGSTAEELGAMRNVEDEKKSKERIMAERAAKPQAKLRLTGSAKSSDLQYRFHRIEPLTHLPNPTSAKEVLNRLANDSAIRHVMQKHKFTVGLLTELAPHEAPHLLGLNENAGQSIKLRIRTNDYDGFRHYRDVRRVLCHELTHNVWGDHDNDFKELNSQLNREVAEYERSVSQGTHYLGGSSDYYEPSSELQAEAQEYTLGGSSVSNTALGGAHSSLLDESREERRQRVLRATMKRLKKEEEELEQSCGTAGPSTD